MNDASKIAEVTKRLLDNPLQVGDRVIVAKKVTWRGWAICMDSTIGKMGTVTGFANTGEVAVYFDPTEGRWFYPREALERVFV